MYTHTALDAYVYQQQRTCRRIFIICIAVSIYRHVWINDSGHLNKEDHEHTLGIIHTNQPQPLTHTYIQYSCKAKNNKLSWCVYDTKTCCYVTSIVSRDSTLVHSRCKHARRARYMVFWCPFGGKPCFHPGVITPAERRSHVSRPRRSMWDRPWWIWKCRGASKEESVGCATWRF